MALFVVALALTTVVQIRNASEPYNYRHGFISAVFATIARNFAHFGILGLSGIPVENNPPITAGDAYIHWPPAFPAILSIWFRFFGTSELVAHIWMLVIELASALVVFAIAREWLGACGGALAGFFWLTLPVIVHYGHVVVPESLAILLMLLAVFGLLRDRPWLVGSAAFLAMCTSWEAALLPLGFWIAAIVNKRRDHRHMVAISTLAVLAGLALVWGVYVSYNPALVSDAIQTALFRMGLSPTYPQSFITHSPERYLGWDESISRIAVNFPRMLGILGAGALVQLALSRPKGSAAFLYGLGTPWLGWCILMRNHMAAHDIEMQLAAPLAAIALAWMTLSVWAKRTASLKTCIAACLIFVFLTVQPWVFGTEKSPEDPKQILGFAAQLRKATDSGSVILSPLISAIPLYYSERHLVRDVSDEETIKRIVPAIRREYPQSRIYWATPLYREPWAVIAEIR
jgi:4-amino-4-deoxy-L-arabinose transferase-like glycosyltransferase